MTESEAMSVRIAIPICRQTEDEEEEERTGKKLEMKMYEYIHGPIRQNKQP